MTSREEKKYIFDNEKKIDFPEAVVRNPGRAVLDSRSTYSSLILCQLLEPRVKGLVDKRVKWNKYIGKENTEKLSTLGFRSPVNPLMRRITLVAGRLTAHLFFMHLNNQVLPALFQAKTAGTRDQEPPKQMKRKLFEQDENFILIRK